jgi:hypothetical protein
MREQKRLRDAERKAREQRITGGLGGSLFGTDGRPNIDNAFIDRILNDEDPYSKMDEEEKKEHDTSSKNELKQANFVVDMEVQPPVSIFLW